MKIIGHKKQQKALSTFFEKKKIPHAFLFSGPRKVGKKTVALWFLRMINCNEKNAPCEKCRSCYEIKEGIHPDIINVYADEKEIQLNQVEQLIEKVSMRGFKSFYKGVLIDDAHLMNTQSQNAILKTLEEPSENTVLILVTEYPNMLLSTITSRVLQMKFSSVSEKEIMEFTGDATSTSLSLGKPGKALDYLNFPEIREKEEKTREEMSRLAREDLSYRFAVAKNLSKEKNMEEIIRSWIACTREEMRKKMKRKEKTDSLRKILKEMEEIVFLSSKTNINKQLALEKIMIKL